MDERTGRVDEGQPGAHFDEFVRTRTSALLRVAFPLTGDRHAAEDLLQDVFEQVYVRYYDRYYDDPVRAVAALAAGRHAALLPVDAAEVEVARAGAEPTVITLD